MKLICMYCAYVSSAGYVTSRLGHTQFLIALYLQLLTHQYGFHKGHFISHFDHLVMEYHNQVGICQFK